MRRLVAIIVLPCWLLAWGVAPLVASSACAAPDCCRDGHCAMCAKGLCRKGMCGHGMCAMMMQKGASAGLHAADTSDHGECAMCSNDDQQHNALHALDISLQPALLAHVSTGRAFLRPGRFLTAVAVTLPVAPSAAPWEPPRS